MSQPEQASHRPLPATSKESLEARIHDYETDVYPIYESASVRNYHLSELASWTAILAGVAVSGLSAFRETGLVDGKFSGVIVIMLPIVGSLAAALQGRFLERKNLFESGRQKMMSTLRKAKQRFAQACEEKTGDFAKIEEETRVEVDALEAARLTGYLAIARRDSEMG